MPRMQCQFNYIVFNLYDLSTYSAIVHDVRMRRMINDSDILFYIARSNCIEGINVDSIN